MEMPFDRGTFAGGHFEDRDARGGVRRPNHDRGLRGAGKGTSLLATLESGNERADGNCAPIDYGFHMIVSDVTRTTLKEKEWKLHRQRRYQLQDVHGLPGVFLRDRREILLATAAGGPNGSDHDAAENGIAIRFQLVAQALGRG